MKAPLREGNGAWRFTFCLEAGSRDHGQRDCLFCWVRFQGLCACFSPSPGIKDEQHQARDSYPCCSTKNGSWWLRPLEGAEGFVPAIGVLPAEISRALRR